MNHVEAAVARVKLAYDSLQCRSPGEKLYVAYSGGKDSDAMLQICREAVGDSALETHYHATGIDPSELVQYVKRRFKVLEDTMECHFDKPRAKMHDLILMHGPPTRCNRFCCAELKEGYGTGRVVVTGVRWAEGNNRANNHDVLTVMSSNKGLREKYNNDNDISRRIIEHCTTKSRLTINPIVDWPNTRPLVFLKEKGLSYCSLYDEGFDRLGCIGCPNSRHRRGCEFRRWPYMERYYKCAFREAMITHPRWRDKYSWHTVDDIWHWWMEDGVIPGQISMFEEAAP